MADLYSWGSRYLDGHGGVADTTVPTLVSGGWGSVVGGYTHSAGIKQDGTLWAWGTNSYGELGNSAAGTDSLTPVQAGGDADWMKVAVGNAFTIALKTDGSLWGWGRGGWPGHMPGLTGFTNPAPSLLAAGPWVDVMATDAGTYVVKADGSLWACGTNSAGQLGVGYWSSSVSPLAQAGVAADWGSLPTAFIPALGSFHAIKAGGALMYTGYPDMAGVDEAAHVNAFTASAPGAWAKLHSAYSAAVLGIKTDGTLWAWGYSYHGVLGNGTVGVSSPLPVQIGSADNWVAVSAGSNNAGAVNSLGELYMWGDNQYGTLGDGGTTDALFPTLVRTGVTQISIGSSASFALTSGAAPAPAFWTDFVQSREVV